MKLVTLQRSGLGYLMRLQADDYRNFNTREEHNRYNNNANLTAAYDRIAKMLHYEEFPIFCLQEGCRGDAYGVNATENSCLIGLDVPDHMVMRHKYFSWTDYIYFLEESNHKNDDDYDYLLSLENKIITNTDIIEPDDPVQCMIPYIKCEWVKWVAHSKEVIKDYLENYDGNINLVKDFQAAYNIPEFKFY